MCDGNDVHTVCCSHGLVYYVAKGGHCWTNSDLWCSTPMNLQILKGINKSKPVVVHTSTVQSDKMFERHGKRTKLYWKQNNVSDKSEHIIFVN